MTSPNLTADPIPKLIRHIGLRLSSLQVFAFWARKPQTTDRRERLSSIASYWQRRSVRVHSLFLVKSGPLILSIITSVQ